MRRFLLCAAVILAAIQLSASPVDLRQAQMKAQKFVAQKLYGGTLRAPIAGEMKLAHAEMNSTQQGLVAYYIFNSANGYVIVSGDDRAEEILGYGDTPLDINSIPCNMRAWLATYKEQLEYLQAHEGMQVETPSMMAPSLRIESVAPLLTANWDQEAPYWKQCVINGNQCLTGCPATSAAMVFYYWKYPDFETPEVPAYRCELSTSFWGGSSYVNVAALPPVTFDWDNMLDNYNSSYNNAQANAVATLMRYIGQAEHMAYGTSAAGGSGVNADSVSLISDAFKFFGYDEETVRMVKKTSAYSGGTTLYSDAEWAALIQEELAESRPIVFCAIASGYYGGGHAFNIDGYDATTNKYHINFGWSGSSNNYYALNAFNGGGSTYNQYQQMVIGIQPPMKIPRLTTTPNELAMSCFKNHTDTAEFTVKGRNLEGDVTLTLQDENGVFILPEAAVTPDEDGKVENTFTVVYAPKAEGEYVGTVTVSTPGVEDYVITLHGTSVYELYRPVMLAPNEQYVTATSFRAEWSDNTPAENVVSYTLEVRNKPDVSLLAEADWSEVPDESPNHASDVQNYLPEDWTFTGNNFYLNGGFVSTNRGAVLNPNCDLTGYNMVSVIVVGKAYERATSSTIDISTDVETKTIVLPRDVDTCLVVLEVGANQTLKLTTGYYPNIQKIKIYGGEIANAEPFALRANETGNGDLLLIEGITPDKFYDVRNLTAGAPYLYRVKSFYVNGTESSWSNSKEVLLLQGETVKGDVNGDGVIDIMDASLLVDYLLAGAGNVNLSAADVNGDGEVSVGDAAMLVDYLLAGSWPR